MKAPRLTEVFLIRENGNDPAFAVLRKRWAEVQRAMIKLAGDEELIPKEFRGEFKLQSVNSFHVAKDDQGFTRYEKRGWIIYVLPPKEMDKLDPPIADETDNEILLPPKDGYEIGLVMT